MSCVHCVHTFDTTNIFFFKVSIKFEVSRKFYIFIWLDLNQRKTRCKYEYICLILSQPEADLIRKFSLTFVFNVFFNNPCGVIFQEKPDPYSSQTGHVCLNFLNFLLFIFCKRRSIVFIRHNPLYVQNVYLKEQILFTFCVNDD